MTLPGYLIGALALVCGILYALYAREANIREAREVEVAVVAKQAETAVAQAKQTNADLLAENVRQREARAAAEATAAKYDKLARARAAALAQAQRRILSAPASDDAPIAPVLLHELDSLRTVQPPAPAGADSADKGGDGIVKPAGGTPDVPAEAGAPGS